MDQEQKDRRIQLIRKDVDGEITLEEISELTRLNSVYFNTYATNSNPPRKGE